MDNGEFIWPLFKNFPIYFVLFLLSKKFLSFFQVLLSFPPALLSLHLSKYFSMSYIFFVLFWFTDTLLKLNDLPIKMDNSFPPSNVILKEIVWSNEADLLKFLSRFFLSVLKNIINGGKKRRNFSLNCFSFSFLSFFFS